MIDINIKVDHYFHTINSQEILNAITQFKGEIMPTVADIQTKQAEVIAAIAAETAIDQSILNLVTADSALIASLRQQLADALASGNPAAIQAVLDSMDGAVATINANAKAIADAVTANTQP